MTHFLDVNNVGLTIDNKTLLSNISFQIQSGDYLCILGPNGAGKSSLLKILMGIIPASSGEIHLQDSNVLDLSQKQRAQQLSYVPQSHKGLLHFSVEEFIKMARYAYHSALSDWHVQDKHAMERAVEITHTEAFLQRQMNTLSGGEAQRVMIAAALCQQTPLLLLDEPTSFLDPRHQVEVHQLIRELNQQHNISIIEVSHDLNHAAQHSQHILALKNGKTQWYGVSKDLLQTEHLKALYDQDFVFTTHPQTGATIALANELP
ncbi:ABC transporter ATP-binding protein [Pseudomonadota bacterium]|nr:ABC transporter ATP-binding protein [Pseudomonadota bacterium]